jgi:hypothetical protein
MKSLLVRATVLGFISAFSVACSGGGGGGGEAGVGSPAATTPRFAYVANFLSANVSAYTIDAGTGALTAIPGSPFAAGPGAVSITTTGTIQ